jgi:hypothetical protein
MIKSLAAFAIFATLSAAVIAVPAFAPIAKASEAVALAKGDRLAIHVVRADCDQQVWPNFATACLRNGDSQARLVEARLVTARR